MLRCPRLAVAARKEATVICKYTCKNPFGRCANDFCLDTGEVVDARGLLKKKLNCVEVLRGAGKGSVVLKLPVGLHDVGDQKITVISGDVLEYDEERDVAYVKNEFGNVEVREASLSGRASLVWGFWAPARVVSLAAGNLVAVAADCGYMIKYGNVLDKFCSNRVPTFADARGNKYAFCFDDVVWVFNDGMWKDFYVGYNRGNVVALTERGFVACWDSCVAREDDNSWELDVGKVVGKVAYSSGVLYIPDYERKKVLVVDVDEGRVVEELKGPGRPVWTYARRRDLAVAGEGGLKVYRDGEQIFEVKGSFRSVAMSPKGRFVAAATKREVLIYDYQGFLLQRVPTDSAVTSSDWGKFLYVGTSNGGVLAFAYPFETSNSLSEGELECPAEGKSFFFDGTIGEEETCQ